MITPTTPPASWVDRVVAVVRDSPLGPTTSLEILQTHRRDHLLAVATGSRGQRWFVKAFERSALTTFRTETSLYRVFDGQGIAPTLRFVDEAARVIATDVVEGGRLGDLPVGEVHGSTAALPALYVALCGRPIGRARHETFDALAEEWLTLAARPEGEWLPDSGTVISILRSLPRYAVHGDFQPSNVLIGNDGPLAVDFESYGLGLPGMDIARMAYNPQLLLTDDQREGLAGEWIERLDVQGFEPLSSRAFAACTVAWAVSCAAYFQSILESDPATATHTPEAVPLSVLPLKFASKLWNRAT